MVDAAEKLSELLSLIFPLKPISLLTNWNYQLPNLTSSLTHSTRPNTPSESGPNISPHRAQTFPLANPRPQGYTKGRRSAIERWLGYVGGWTVFLNFRHFSQTFPIFPIRPISVLDWIIDQGAQVANFRCSWKKNSCIVYWRRAFVLLIILLIENVLFKRAKSVINIIININLGIKIKINIDNNINNIFVWITVSIISWTLTIIEAGSIRILTQSIV